ncbi:MAG: 3'-5' exonuclease [Verrucomicrobia bacterium]|nr:3'-5' exonuclease [Verrucomicrobiota bacterium]
MSSFSFLGKQRMIEDILETPRPWHKHAIHCLDFEGSRRSGIVEYGLVTILDLEVVAMETRLCQAIGPIPEMEAATHQIRQTDVELSDPFSESWNLFRDKRLEGPFAAHHAGVENGLIKSVWPFVTQCPNFITGTLDVDWGPWLDTCALYRALFPDLESYNLSKLISNFDLNEKLEALAQRFCPESRNSFHCAPYDALASSVLILQLHTYDELRALTLEQLLKWSQPGKGVITDGNQLELL